MFRVRPDAAQKTFRPAIVALLAFSVAAFAITVWVMVEFLDEQRIVQDLIRALPPESKGEAEALSGELRWQFRLSILVVLNLVVTACALVLLSRAYRSSQESLRDVKTLAADILSSMDLAVLTIDRTGTVTSINRGGMEMLGVSERSVGQPVHGLSSEFDLDELGLDSLAEGGPLVSDFSAPSKDQRRTLKGFCQPLQNYEGKEIGYVIQLRDVTERLLIDDRLRRMERYLGLGTLAAGLHHEIRNPLAALSLHVQLLAEQLDDEKSVDEVRQSLAVIRTEVARIEKVLDGFRDFASVNRLNLAEVDLEELIRRQIELLRPRAEQKQVEIQLTLEAPIPPVIADRVRLEQVLLNLLLNAMEAMPGGGEVTIAAVSGPETLEIQVRDTGRGIPVDLRDRVFDPYFTTKGDGTGLGLALCDKIMRQHDGSLEFHCDQAGTIFEMTLPLKSPAQHP